MKRALFLFACGAVFLGRGDARAQMTLEQAREEGRALGAAKRNDSALVPSSEAQAQAVPGYAGTSLPENAYFDDPERLEAVAQSDKSSNAPYRMTTDADRARPVFGNAEILATTSRASAIEKDPSAYLDGQDMGGAQGRCVPLPTVTHGNDHYEASCNAGSRIEEERSVCLVPHVPQFVEKPAFNYSCGLWYNEVLHQGRQWIFNSSSSSCSGFEMAPACTLLSSSFLEERRFVGRLNKERDLYASSLVRTYSCAAPASSANGSPYCDAFGCFVPAPVVEMAGGTTRTYSGAKEDFSQCARQAQAGECTIEASQCVDSEPRTRMIGGVAVTQDCWAFERTYQCRRLSPANDCGELEANGSCTFARTECLDEEPDAGPCRIENRVYTCLTPAGAIEDASQYICGDDIWCLNGECEPIVREASREFKDALVALHAIDQAGREFDEADLRVFSGTRETCHKPVFGLVNCCAGKVSGLLTAGAGAAALAGGPAAIAALATPFLTLFACSQGEMKLDIRDRMGLCHNVGAYCASSVLGICTTRRTAYCCFESKLSRILQEQGRAQLGKPWGNPRKEQCIGFTIDEFARLDLSVMDFTEIYAEFVEAARLPDEVQTMTDIQQKVRNYYDLHATP